MPSIWGLPAPGPSNMYVADAEARPSARPGVNQLDISQRLEIDDSSCAAQAQPIETFRDAPTVEIKLHFACASEIFSATLEAARLTQYFEHIAIDDV